MLKVALKRKNKKIPMYIEKVKFHSKNLRKYLKLGIKIKKKSVNQPQWIKIPCTG